MPQGHTSSLQQAAHEHAAGRYIQKAPQGPACDAGARGIQPWCRSITVVVSIMLLLSLAHAGGYFMTVTADSQ
jgi:hypothetical protein